MVLNFWRRRREGENSASFKGDAGSDNQGEAVDLGGQPAEPSGAVDTARVQRESEERALKQGQNDVDLAMERGTFICRFQSSDSAQILIYWEGVATALVKTGIEQLRDAGIELLKRINAVDGRSDSLMTEDLTRRVDEALFGVEDPTIRLVG